MNWTAFAIIGLLLAVSSTLSASEEAPPQPPELRLALDVAVTTTIGVEVLKRAFKDPRPDGTDYGFPSGHTAIAFALARVAGEYHPQYKALWYLIAARIAWSRVKDRAHDWQDVLGGAALGAWVGEEGVTRGGILLARVEW